MKEELEKSRKRSAKLNNGWIAIDAHLIGNLGALPSTTTIDVLYMQRSGTQQVELFLWICSLPTNCREQGIRWAQRLHDPAPPLRRISSSHRLQAPETVVTSKNVALLTNLRPRWIVDSNKRSLLRKVTAERSCGKGTTTTDCTKDE